VSYYIGHIPEGINVLGKMGSDYGFARCEVFIDLERVYAFSKHILAERDQHSNQNIEGN
jgi:hypothetical protein